MIDNKGGLIMLSFFILLFILATCFEGDFESVTIDTWVIVFAISLSTDIQIFRWISKK